MRDDYRTALNQMRKIVSDGGIRVEDEVRAVKKAGKDLMLAAQEELELRKEFEAILIDRNKKRIEQLKKSEIQKSKKEIESLADSIGQYGLLIKDLLQDFYILVTLLKNLKEEALQASENPKEKELGQMIMQERRQLVSDLEPLMEGLTQTAVFVGESLRELR